MSRDAQTGDRGRPATFRARRRMAVSGAMAASLVCGLLIWAKLRLVTDIPRTAYATPERRVEATPIGAEAGTNSLESDAPALPATAGVDEPGD